MNLIFWSAILIRIIVTESRVVCGGSNASPWTALGPSCPVNCRNVMYAIEKLKMIDYHNLLLADVEVRADLSSSNQVMNSIEAQIHLAYNMTHQYRRSLSNLPRERRRSSGRKEELYEEFKRLLATPQVFSQLQSLATSRHLRPTCAKLLKRVSLKKALFKKVLAKCSRRSSVEEDFLNTLTGVLNEYTQEYMFTIDMTRALLQKILGNNMDLRNGIFDIKKILSYLQTAISSRGEEVVQLETMVLQGRHCLTTFVPGCFCKRGFVEREGICVAPSNCSMHSSLKKYLPRISVHTLNI